MGSSKLVGNRLLRRTDVGKCRQDKYVGVMGSIKIFGNKRHVSATHIRAIKNHDEVYHHLLKATWVSLSMRHPNGAVSLECALQPFKLIVP
jgi:hypothetical protein